MRQTNSDKTDALIKALVDAQGELVHADKSSTNPHFRSKYADLPAVLDAAKPTLQKHGLGVNHFRGFDEQGNQFLVTQLMHKESGQWLRSHALLKPVKDDPQGIGSAITYARRYDFQAILGMASEDDDGNAASQGKQESKQEPAFKNAALRRTFCDNVISSFREASEIEELKTLAKLNEAKFKEMDQTGNEHDKQGVDELRKQYKAAEARIKSGVASDDAVRAGFGQGFADVRGASDA